MSDNSNKVDGRITAPKELRALFLHVLEARKVKVNGKERGEPQFDGLFVLDADTYKAMSALAVQVARAKWPDRPLGEIRWPFTKAEVAMEEAKKARKDTSIYTAGTVLLTARTKNQPILSRIVNGEPTEFTPQQLAVEGKKLFYNGAYVVPRVNFVAYDGVDGGKDGVKAYLDQVLWYKNGNRIGGVSAAEAFKGFAGANTNVDPGAGTLDDEIPF